MCVNILLSRPISWLCFIFSLSISILTIIPAIFPAFYPISTHHLLLSNQSMEILSLNPVQIFEFGIFWIPVIAGICMIPVFYFLSRIKQIQDIRKINISKRNTYFVLIGLLVIFFSLEINTIYEEDKHADFQAIVASIEEWPPDNHMYVKMSLLKISNDVFGNYRIIPLITSAILIVTTFSFTNKLAGNRISGLIAAAVLLQSNLFLSFSSTPSYTVFWVLFYLLSLHIMSYRTSYLSPISYIAAIFSKQLVVSFLPMSIWFALSSEMPLKIKLFVILSTVIIIFVGVYIAYDIVGNLFTGFDSEDFWRGFTSFSYQMRYDVIPVMFLIPVVVGLFKISKNSRYANSISLLITGILLTNPLITGFTYLTNQPYRFVPFIVFFAIAVGMIISNKIKQA